MGSANGSEQFAGIILRHVEPIVRATRDGLVAASRDLIRERMERDQALAKLAEATKERDHLLGKFREMEGNAIMERCRADRTEAHSSQSDALLRELAPLIEYVGKHVPLTLNENDRSENTSRIMAQKLAAHLATATTKEGK